MAYTYSKIATYTVGSGGIASINFLNIPQTYTDLVLKISGRNTSTNQTVGMQFNTDATTANYLHRELYGTGSVAQSTNATGFYTVGYLSGSNDTASTFGTADVYIPNYTSGNYKSISSDTVEENNGAAALAALTAGIWYSTSPITSIALTMYGGNFAQYSTAHLYGIKNEV